MTYYSGAKRYRNKDYILLIIKGCIKNEEESLREKKELKISFMYIYIDQQLYQ